MAAQSAVTGQNNAPFSVSLQVQQMVVVQHPERVQSLYSAVLSLLPVNPPEVHSDFLIGMVQVFKISLQKFNAGHIKVNRVLMFHIDAQFLCHFLISILKGHYSVCRMDIQGDLIASVMKPGHEPLRVREEILIPGISGPAPSILPGNVYNVPVHVHNHHGKGHSHFLKPLKQLHVALFRIFVVTAPPVS